MKIKIISFILSTYLIDLKSNKKFNLVKIKNKYFFILKYYLIILSLNYLNIIFLLFNNITY